MLDRMKEQLSKEIWLSSQNLNSYKEETTSKIMQMTGEMKCLRAELETEKGDRKTLAQELERERVLIRELRDRVTRGEQDAEVLRQTCTDEIAARQTLEAVHSKRLAALEADQLEAKRLFDAHGAAYQTYLIETEAHHKNFVTEAKFATQLVAMEQTLRDYVVLQDRDTRLKLSEQSELVERVEAGIEALEGRLREEVTHKAEEARQRVQEAVTMEMEVQLGEIRHDWAEERRRMAVMAADLRSVVYESDTKWQQSERRTSALEETLTASRQYAEDLDTYTKQELLQKVEANLDKLNIEERTVQHLTNHVKELDIGLKVLQTKMKSDVDIKIDHLEMFELDAKKRLAKVEEKAKQIKDFDVASLDSRLREEVHTREVLEHRCRFLPKS